MVEIPGYAAQQVGKLMAIKFTHKFITIMAYHLLTGELSHLVPGRREQNGWVENYKHDTHEGVKLQQPLLTQTPTRFRKSLEHEVVGSTDCQELRYVFRRQHSAECSGGRPIEFFRSAVRLTFCDALSAQPEEVGQQKEE